MRRLQMTLAMVLVLALGVPRAQAEIVGFTINDIEGLGDLEGLLDDRLTDDYVINYDDCLLYLEGYVPGTSGGDESECTEDQDCLDAGEDGPCSRLSGTGVCVECLTNSDCVGNDEGNFVCDLATRTCAQAPIPGDCVTDGDCADGFCGLWNGSFTCLACILDGDCAEGEVCQFDEMGSTCVVPEFTNEFCDACPSFCFYDSHQAWQCGSCLTNEDCALDAMGPFCNLATHICGEAESPWECETDNDCQGGVCVLWDGEYQCRDCAEDADCGTSSYCVIVSDMPQCVECAVDDDCVDGVCGDTFTCEEKTTSTTTGSRKILLKWSLDSGSYSGGEYSIKVGSSCSESGEDQMDSEETDTCTTLAAHEEFDGSYTNKEVSIDLTDLLGDTCVYGEEDDLSIYFYASYYDLLGVEEIDLEKFDITYDAEPPYSPTNVTVEAGEKNLKLSWDDDSNNEDVEYKVYYATFSFDEDNKVDADSKSGITAQSYQVEGLTIGTSYYIAVVAVDEADNESALSEILFETPVSVSDFWEYYQESGGGEQGGFCFVATAAWGTPMQPAVTLLRVFRDRVLLSSAWGRSFVDWYYLHGPAAASFIRGSEALRLGARVLLVPAVAVAYAAVVLPAQANALLLLLTMMAGVLLWRRRLAASCFGRCGR